MKIENNKLLTTVYTKPIDFKSYLLYNSGHPKSTLNSIPYSRFLRVRRICTLDQDFLTNPINFTHYYAVWLPPSHTD